MSKYKNTKNILITSYWFFPEITPRAFRTFELIKELSNRGYYVDLYLPNKAIYKTNHPSTIKNCTVYYIDTKDSITSSGNKRYRNENRRSYIERLIIRIKKMVGYMIGGSSTDFKYCHELQKVLIENSTDTKYDLIISIGLPFYIHLATAIFINRTNQQGKKICDYGDPYYLNPSNTKFWGLRYIEKWVTNQFDFISIPTEKSLNYYTMFKDDDEIKVIPQGFNFDDIKLEVYIKNDIPNFCYAGVFYRQIRNPEYLFEFLTSLKIDYRFIIYTRIEDHFVEELIIKYKDKFGKRLIVRDFIPRNDLIKEMSKFEFLVNLENDKSDQVPSKVIDYALSRRPILNINKETFSKQKFLEFLMGNYDSAIKVNIDDYDIKNIVDKFEALID